MSVLNFEDFERLFGFDIPNKFKDIDTIVPQRTHIVFF